MKRISNKKRKLKYIREKNHLRCGGTSVLSFKVATQFLEDKELSEPFLKEKIRLDLTMMSKKYKLRLHTTELSSGLLADDFVKDLKTVVVKVKLNNN